jgi:ribosomal protein S18 acetylase RimI-like enzyme
VIHLNASARESAIRAGWQAYAERLPEGAEPAYLKACEGWDVLAVQDDDKTVGALFAKGGIVHIGIVPEYRGRWASRRLIREILKHGTRTEFGPSDDAEFLERFRGIACRS